MKRKMWKRIWALFLCGVLCLTCAVNAFAREIEEGETDELNDALVISVQPEKIKKSDKVQSIVLVIVFSETVVINAISAKKVLVPEGWSVAVKGIDYTLENDANDHLISVGYDKDTKMIAGAYSDEDSYPHIDGLRLTYNVPANTAGSFSLGVEDLWVGTISGIMVISGVNATKTVKIEGEDNGTDDSKPEVKNVTLDCSSLNLRVGESATLRTTVLPEEAADADVTWTTSDRKVATVENGAVTGVGEGTATITASAGKQSAICAVKVTAAENHPKQEDSEELRFHKERALATLKKQYGKYSQSDYDATEWAQLTAAYEQGMEGILNAEPALGAFIEDNVSAALNAALDAMQAIPAARTHPITVAVSMDANTLGLGLLIEPTLVTVDNHEQASVVITQLIEQMAAEKFGVTGAGLSSKGESEPAGEYPWIITGSVTGGFYLAQVYWPEQENVEIADFILDRLGTGAVLDSDRSGDYLGEFDYTNTSGWMYSIGDGYGTEFPGVGASGWRLSEGEVMRWQFTVYGYGSDLGADNTAWGQSSLVDVGDKTDLTWHVAELRSQYSDNKLKSYKTYTDALSVLADPQATSTQIDAALKALKAEAFDDTVTSVTLNKSTVTVTVGSSVTLTATVDSDTAKNKTVTWTSSDERIATVSGGVVTGVKAGTAVITATAGGKSAQCTVTVVEKEAKVKPASATATVTPEVTGGKAKAEISAGDLKEALEKTTNAAMLTVKVDTAGAECVEADLPAAAVKAAADAGVGLRIETELGTVTVDGVMVRDVAKRGKTMAMMVKKNADGTATIDVTADGKTAEAEVKVELTAKDSQVLVIVGADGTETVVKKSVTENGRVYAIVPAGARVKAVNAKEMSFDDVKVGDWFAGAVKFVTSRGIFQGVGDGFAPNAPMNRAMLVTVLQRIAGEQAKGENKFGDVKADDWFADAVIWASENGIANGTGAGFEPDASVTREQIATMLYRFVKYLNMDTSDSKTLKDFPDGGSTSEWAKEAMQWAVGVGLFKGDANGELNPGSRATRAEVATLVERLIGLMVK